MRIRTLTLGEFQTNCYLVSDDNGVTAVIDPGYEPEKIRSVLENNHLTLGAILLTHGHFDHVGGVKALAKTGCPVYLNENDLSLPSFLTAGDLYYTHSLRGGDRIAVGGLTFTVLETPGHTPGSVCLECGTALFSGDTLFAGGWGRTDLGGDMTRLRESLELLGGLPGALEVFPGHGDRTTLEEERRRNPYLRKRRLP